MPSRSAAGRTSSLRRIAFHTLMWAGPISVALAILLLLASARFFRHGPGVPTAGDERAWNVLWGAAGLLALGSLIGLFANLAWLARAMLRGQRPSTVEWIRTLANLVLGIAFALLWFG